jgi:hypothetical protein
MDLRTDLDDEEKSKFLTLQGLELRPLGLPAGRQSQYRLRYPRSSIIIQVRYIHSVRTSRETHYVSATKPNLLILFNEIIAVYCENHTARIHTLCFRDLKCHK